MVPTNKVFFLPDRETMLARLLAVESERHVVERFFPRLLKYAGQRKVAAGVSMLLDLAIYDYTEGLPSGVQYAMRMKAPDYIDAICGEDNKDIAEEAKKPFKLPGE